MMKKMNSMLIGLLLIFLTTQFGFAGTPSTLSIQIIPSPLMTQTTQISVSALWPAGTIIAALSPVGGDGNPVSYVIAGDVTDFALSSAPPCPTNTCLVVGPNGISPTVINTIVNVNITPNQS